MNGLYLKRHSNELRTKEVLYIHGGPGGTSEGFEQFWLNHSAYQNSDFNFTFFDQRCCGRSEIFEQENYTHRDNVEDLIKIIDHSKFDIILAHSYGSYLAYDAIQESKNKPFVIFAGVSETSDVPKYNNILLDLLILKQQNPQKYQEIYQKIATLGDKSWTLREEIRNSLENFEQKFEAYWMNLDAQKEYNEYMVKGTNTFNSKVFFEVRTDYFNNLKDNKLDLSKVEKAIRVVGQFDFIMGGSALELQATEKFYASSHYPHIEEPQKMVELLNRIIKEGK